MSSLVRRMMIAGAAMGLIAGIVVALAIPRDRDGRAAAAPATPNAGRSVPQASGTSRQVVGIPVPSARPPRPGATRPRRVRPSLRVPTGGGYIQLRRRGAFDIAVTVPDPRGGPSWAVRVFRADRVVPKDIRRKGVDPVIGHDRCVQLGRVYHGSFGWLDASGTFRATGVTLTGAPTSCPGASRSLTRTYADVVQTITQPGAPVADPVQTVAWGISGGADAATGVASGHRLAVKVGRQGAFLAVASGSVDPSTLMVTTTGRTTRAVLPLRSRGIPPLPPRFRARFGAPVTGAPTVLTASAPDPAGGLPFGLATTPAQGGGWCVGQAGRVVGHHVGEVDYRLDVVRVARVGALDCPQRTSAHPPDGRTFPPYRMSSSFGGAGVPELGADPAGGQVARRLLPGRVTYSGTADADVASLTFATPQDVRTIRPSGPAHAFLVVYAGTFPTGDTVITTTYRNGKTRHDTIGNESP